MRETFPALAPPADTAEDCRRFAECLWAEMEISRFEVHVI